jgi:hypothetical protein
MLERAPQRGRGSARRSNDKRPAHPGVENVVLQINGQTDGFVVTYIPVGLNVPYRTLGDKEEYYIRAGSNFIPTPHAVLAGLFGRAPHPALDIVVKYSRYIRGTRPSQLRFTIYARNTGRGIADDLFFIAETTLPEGCEASFATTEHWDDWTIGRRRTSVSKSFPPLPLTLLTHLRAVCGRVDHALQWWCGLRPCGA